MLEHLLAEAPPDFVTLRWLMGGLKERSFGVVLLLLAIVGLIPPVSALVGVVIAILSFEMILGHQHPILPRFIGSRRIQSRRIVGLLRRAIPVTKYLEKVIHPRWHTPVKATQRSVGFIVLILGVTLLTPVPFSNIVPALVILLIAFAYLEHDGLLLGIGFVAALLLLSLASVAIWETL